MHIFVTIAAATTLAATAILAAIFRVVARRIGLVDHPGGRRTHETPTPTIGGIAIFLAVAPIGLWLLPATPQALGLGLAAIVILVAGVADDVTRLSWQYRLAAQVLAAWIVVLVGHIEVQNLGEVFGFPSRPLGLLSPVVTILGIVGVINAVNMVDGADGLAGSIILVAALLAAVTGYSVGNASLAKGLLLLCAGLIGFLAFNLRSPWCARAHIYLGNAGSELLGLIIAAACIRLTQNSFHPVGIQVAPFIIAPALIDCLTLMIRRVRMRKSPFIGDRNHLHHMLLDAGASPTAVVCIMAGATLVIGFLAISALKIGAPAPAFTVAFITLWGGYFLATHSRDVFVERLSKLFHLAAPSWARATGLTSAVKSAPANYVTNKVAP